MIALALSGCCLWPSKEKAVYGPCQKYDLNHDGVVGAPDYSLMMKQKPPPSSVDIAGFQHYFGRTCR